VRGMAAAGVRLERSLPPGFSVLGRMGGLVRLTGIVPLMTHFACGTVAARTEDDYATE